MKNFKKRQKTKTMKNDENDGKQWKNEHVVTIVFYRFSYFLFKS